MAESPEPNGVARPLQDVAADGYIANDDDEKLIGDGTSPGSGSSGGGGRTEMSPLQMEAPPADRHKKTSEGLKIIIISSICFALSVTVALVMTIFLAPPPITLHGAVSSSVDRCSKVGTDALQNGGSAVDAAIATLFCCGVMHAQHSGIGGGGFMVVRQHKENKTTVFNFRETAPGASTADMFDAKPEDAKRGGLSVAIPGELKGLKAAHDKFGKLQWAELVQPAIDIATNGFNVTGILAFDIDKHSADIDGEIGNIYQPGGVPVQEGQTITRPALAKTLKTIALEGIDSFYTGAIAKEIEKTVKDQGGILTLEDLAGYTVQEVEPLISQFQNLTVSAMPAPGGGPLLLLLLHVMESYSLSRANVTNGTDLMYHRLVEAIKFTEAERYRLGDPDMVPMVLNATERLISKEYADKIRKKINDTHTQTQEMYLQNAGVSYEQGTTHVSVVGPEEDFVSVTSSINYAFGSKLMTPGGIILNNHMADFDVPEDPTIPRNQHNAIEPGKRPLSAMSPVVLHSARPCGDRIAIGGVNGSRIVTGVAEVLLNLFGFKFNLTESIERARIHNPLLPDDVVETDVWFDQNILASLKTKGHKNFVNDTIGINFVNAVMKRNETLVAHSDSRQQGSGASIF